MNRLTLLAAAAAMSAAITAPAAAQQVVSNPGYCAQFYPNANCQNRGPNSPYTGDYQRRQARNSNAFWPGDLAAGVVGGAIGTAGALAAAPFGGNSYGWQDESYARRNGFVCQPGTWFRGEDGRPHPCQ
jgi:hypothetical protein